MPISRGSSGPRDQTSILNDYPHWQVGSLPLAPPGKSLGSCQSVRSVAQLCPTLGDPMNCSIPGFPMCHPLPEPAQTHVHQVGDAIQPSHPLSSPSPPAFPSIRVFSNESVLRIRWPKYWNFSFNIRPSNEHSGLISSRMDWLDLLEVQGTLKSLLQHNTSKASIFGAQLSL